MPGRNAPSSRLILITAVVGSLLFSLAHAGPLNGSIAALLIVVAAQIYLPGWLLLSALRIRTISNPLVRFAWGLVTGLSLTIPLAGAFRVLLFPVESYLIALHCLMLLLIFFRDPAPEPLDWRVLRQHGYLYAAIAVFCMIGFVVGVQRSQVRISGWEDQTVFIQIANWLAHNPPDPALPSRQISAFVIERYRWVTDGWTYQHALWDWITGIPSATIIWNLITPLFAWLTPILTFALGYELSGRERHAFYCAVGLTLASLISIESLVYSPGYAFGQNYFAQMNTLRMFSSAIMLPLALMVSFSFLRQPQRQKALIVLLALVTLGILHPRQITIAAITFAVFGGLTWLTSRTRQRFVSTAILMVLVVFCLAIPLAQRALLQSAGAAAGVDVADIQLLESTETDASAEEVPDSLAYVGDFLIVDPQTVLSDPATLIAVVLGLSLPLLGWKRPENLYGFGMTAIMLILLFTPGIAGIFIKIVTPRIAATFLLMLPTAIILGTIFDRVADLFGRYQRVVVPASAALAVIVALALIVEPFPIPVSAKDRITATNQLQNERDILPADQALLQLFASAPDLQLTTPTVILTSNRIANYFAESVTYAEVVGGRVAENPRVHAQVDRFYMRGELASPFLDADDLALMQRWNVQLVVTQTDNARAAALLIEPDRFQLIHQVSGYLVFRVLDTQVTPADQIFKQMNAAYVAQNTGRWQREGFDFTKPGAAVWQTYADQWRAQLEAQPDDDVAAYGAAASALLAGDDAQALPDWERLQAAYANSSLFRQAAAQTRVANGQVASGSDLLIAALSDADEGTRAVAARTLLQPAFVPALDDADFNQIAAAIDASPDAWTLMATYDQPDAVRRYAAILIAGGTLDAADAQLALFSPNSLLPTSLRPEDLDLRAQIRLAQGDVDGALALLQPYLDRDTYGAAAHIHPDRWQTNRAAGLYYLLEGDLAARNGDVSAAVADYESAVANGMTIAGDIFLARAQTAAGDVDAARSTLAALGASGADDAHLWSLIGQWEIAQTTADEAGAQAAAAEASQRLPYDGLAGLPQLRSLLDAPANAQSSIVTAALEGSDTIRVTARLGQIELSPYEVNQWEIVAYDTTTYQRYGDVTLRALLVPGAITEWDVDVALDPALISAADTSELGVYVHPFNPFFHYNGVYDFLDLSSTSAANQGS